MQAFKYIFHVVACGTCLLAKLLIYSTGILPDARTGLFCSKLCRQNLLKPNIYHSRNNNAASADDDNVDKEDAKNNYVDGGDVNDDDDDDNDDDKDSDKDDGSTVEPRLTTTSLIQPPR